MMKKLLIYIIFLAGIFLTTSASAVSAASLQFDPTTKTTPKGENFDIKVDIDAGTNEILATDAKISFDKTLLEVVKIENGGYFKTLGKADYSTAGQIYIAGIVDDPGDFKKGTGTVATVNFKALTDGTATLSYICTPGETGEDSNIANNDFDATDVINCSENGTSRITIGGGGDSSTTPTPTSTGSTTVAPTNTLAPTVSSLPETGLFETATNINVMLPLSILAVLLGLAVKFFLR